MRKQLVIWSLVGVLALGSLCYMERKIYELACLMGADWQCYGVDR